MKSSNKQRLTIKAYLAGAIESCSDLGSTWRKEYQKALIPLGIEAMIPNDLNRENELSMAQWSLLKSAHPTVFKVVFRALIARPDLQMVRDCDFVIVNYEGERTSGTHHEVGYAFDELKKPVYLVSSLPYSEIPSWLLAHTTEDFTCLRDLLDFLKGVEY